MPKPFCHEQANYEIVNVIFAKKVYNMNTVDFNLFAHQLLAGSVGTEYNLLIYS